VLFPGIFPLVGARVVGTAPHTKQHTHTQRREEKARNL
jgi:hypothetical protein